MQSKLRIAVLTAWYPNKTNPVYGIFIKNQASALAENHDVTLIALLESFKKEYEVKTEGNLKIVKQSTPMFAISKKSRYRKWGKKVLKLILQEEGNNPFDIIHLHDIIPTAAAIFLKGKIKGKLVTTLHNSSILNQSLSDSSNILLAKGLDKVDAVICVGKELAKVVSHQYKLDRVEVISNGVNTSAFRIQNRDPHNPIRLLVIGSLVADKGIMEVVEALVLLKDEKKKFNLDIYGNGYLKRRIEKLISSSNMSNNIFLHGEVSHTEIVNIINNHDALISNSKIETFGITMVEGLAAGLPLIFTPVGIGKEFPDFVGQRLNEESTSEIKGAILYLIRNYSQYDRESIKQYAKEHFDNDIVIEKIEKVYKSI